MFDQTSKSAAPTTREAAYRSERNAKHIRGTNADAHIYRTSADTSPRKAVAQQDSRDHIRTAVGLLLMSAIALGGLEVFIRLCANTAMIR